MTPIATKNNAIIIKDGKLAENCGCCTPDEWTCCFFQQCPGEVPLSVELTVSASDFYVKKDETPAGFGSPASFYSGCILAGQANGTHTLSGTGVSGVYSKSIPVTSNGNCGSIILSATVNNGMQADVGLIIIGGNFPSIGRRANILVQQQDRYKSLADLQCTASFDVRSGGGLIVNDFCTRAWAHDIPEEACANKKNMVLQIDRQFFLYPCAYATNASIANEEFTGSFVLQSIKVVF
jgi:hypothetical protein